MQQCVNLFSCKHAVNTLGQATSNSIKSNAGKNGMGLCTCILLNVEGEG